MQERDETLYVLALGALTNVASAILTEPRIRERICVVSLGGWPYHVSDFRDFNFIQDLKAAQTVFDSGVAMVHVTGFGRVGVAKHDTLGDGAACQRSR